MKRRDFLKTSGILSDNPFSLVGSTGAVWIRKSGAVHLSAKHPRLGTQTVELQITGYLLKACNSVR